MLLSAAAVSSLQLQFWNKPEQSLPQPVQRQSLPQVTLLLCLEVPLLAAGLSVYGVKNNLSS